MSRPKQFKFSPRMFAAAAAFAGLVSCVSASVRAAGLNFVNADDLSNLTPSSAIFGTGAGTVGDNLWGYRLTFGTGGSVFETKNSSTVPENSPMLTQRITGLTPGTSYDFYAVFWTDKDSNWGIRAGTAPESLTTTTFRANTGDNPVPGAQQAITAGAALWDTLPIMNDDGLIFTERPGVDPLIMLLGKAGTAVANASGEADVYIDDIDDGTGDRNRSWFDGVAYVTAGGISTLQATVNRSTGALTLTNPTNTPFQIKSISIASDAGALNAPNWTPITGNRDGAGNSSFDADAWVITAPGDIPNTPYATALSEVEVAPNNGIGGTLAANGGTISFGNVWQKSFFEDLRIDLTLADGTTLVSMRPTYTGTGFVPGDFNRDGALNLADYQILTANINTTLTPGMSRVQSNSLGDYTAGGLVDFDDFTLFRAAYDELNGVGAFAQMVASVPEPGSIGLLLSGAIVLARRGRRRATLAAAVATMTCAFAGTSQAAPFLMVDIDDQLGDATGAPAGDNTVPGYSSFVVPPGTPIQVASATIGGYGITMKSVNAAGGSIGSLEDRDRTSPTGTPTLNQLYDDFIFVTGAATGIGGGIDLAVTGNGQLQPNKPYRVSIYAYDVSSNGAANWLDANNFNAPAISAIFTGATAPTTDERYKFTGYYWTDNSGNLLLRGRSTTAAASNSVFINGFEIDVATEALTLQVDVATGAMRFSNTQTAPIDLSYYEIRSASGALNLGSWTSLDDGEGADAFGVGWDEATGSSNNVITELNLTSMSTIAVGGSLGLGSLYNTAGAKDVTFSYAAPGGARTVGIVQYVQSAAPSIPGDFDHNGVVNAADLNEWKTDFGVDGGSDADGDTDTDGADFLIWQRNLGMGAATAATAAVPEPASLALGAIAIGGLAAGCRRRS